MLQVDMACFVKTCRDDPSLILASLSLGPRACDCNVTALWLILFATDLQPLQLLVLYRYDHRPVANK